LIYKAPREGSPDFIKGSLSIKVDELTAFLQEHQNNGWVNLDFKQSQKGKLYFQLNDWKPETAPGQQKVSESTIYPSSTPNSPQRQEFSRPEPSNDIPVSSIPF